MAMGKVGNDANGDGLRQPGEGALAGVTVNLLDPQNNVVASTVRADDGSYSFDVSPGATHRVAFVKPSGFGAFSPQDVGSDDAVDSDADSYGRTALFTVAGAETSYVVVLDAGILPPAGTGTVSGQAWNDWSGDGIQQAGEDGVAGVFVDLINTQTGQIRTVLTNRDGEYLFYGVQPGNYTLVFRPVGLDAVFTGKDLGGDDTIDSDVGANGTTDVFALLAGGLKSYLDAGMLIQAP